MDSKKLLKTTLIWSTGQINDKQFWFANQRWSHNIYYYPNQPPQTEEEEKLSYARIYNEFYGKDGLLWNINPSLNWDHGPETLTIYSDVEPTDEMVKALQGRGFDVYVLRIEHKQ